MCMLITKVAKKNAHGILWVAHYLPERTMKKLFVGGAILSMFLFVGTQPNIAKAQIDIESVSATVNLNTALVEWTTDVSTTGLLEYGTTSGTYTKQVSTDFGTSHNVYLNNLTAETTYYYRVTVTDEDGTSKQSSEKTFLTESTKLAFRSVTEVIRSSNRVVIRVTMNKSAVPNVYLGTQPDVLTKRAENIGFLYGSEGTDQTSLLLAGLKPNTTYYYQAVATRNNIYGNPVETTVSEVHSIRTRGIAKVTSITRSGESIIIRGQNFGEGSSSPLQVAVGVGCSLSKWPSTTPKCLTTITSWSDSQIVAKFKTTTPRHGIVYVAKTYQKAYGYVNLFTIKGPSL